MVNQYKILVAEDERPLSKALVLKLTKAGYDVMEVHDEATEICKTAYPGCSGVTLAELTTDAKYLVAIPIDPSQEDEQGTGYTIILETNGRVTVDAPNAEQSETISVTR